MELKSDRFEVIWMKNVGNVCLRESGREEREEERRG